MNNIIGQMFGLGPSVRNDCRDNRKLDPEQSFRGRI